MFKNFYIFIYYIYISYNALCRYVSSEIIIKYKSKSRLNFKTFKIKIMIETAHDV